MSCIRYEFSLVVFIKGSFHGRYSVNCYFCVRIFHLFWSNLRIFRGIVLRI